MKHGGGLVRERSKFFEELRRLGNFDEFEGEVLGHIEKRVNFGEMEALLRCDRNVDYLFVDPMVRIPLG